MKNLARILVMSVLLTGFVSCNDDDEDDTPNITTFTATLNGASEVPPNASTATGVSTLNFNEDTNEFSISVPFMDMNATAAHIHKGAVGQTGPPVFPFEGTNSPLLLNGVELTEAQEADLKAGLYYVNVHSAAFPDGEIRGQLIQQD